MVKVHFLGTAAAEGFPNPFCLCDACERAREKGGKNIRSRSSVIFDDVLKVDFPPDFFHHAIMQNLRLASIKDLLITHTHYDHFHPGDLFNRIESFAHGIEHPLEIYGHDIAMHELRKALPASQFNRRFSLNLVQPFQEVEIETAKITPLVADHDRLQTCLLYYIERNGKKIFYGNDTGWFPEETWEWLQGKQVDLAILDCTGGFNNDKRARNHMCIETVIEVQKRFKEEKSLAEDGKIVATHFTHNSKLLHDEFVEAFDPYGIIVAYDGMILNL